MKIIISPYSSKLRNGLTNAKDYPYWSRLIDLLKPDHDIIQIGVSGEKVLIPDFRFDLKLSQLKYIINQVDLFISVDNFFPHFCHFHGKSGIVIFSKSDPLIFGYKENINILKHRKYLRPHQFQTWEECAFDKDAFVEPEVVINDVAAFRSAIIAPSRT